MYVQGTLADYPTKVLIRVIIWRWFGRWVVAGLMVLSAIGLIGLAYLISQQ